MKRLIIAVIVFLLLLISSVPVSAGADYSQEESEISSQVDELLEDYDIGWDMSDLSGMSFSELFSAVRESLSSRAGAPVKMLGTLLAVAVFTSVVRSVGESAFPENSGQMYDMICVITAVAVIAPQLMTVYGSAMNAVERVGGFITVFVPLLSAIVIAGGGVTSGAAYNVLTLGASETLIILSQSYLMPVLSLISVLTISGSAFPYPSLDSLASLIKKVTTWIITVAMTLFTGFVSLKCTLTAKADGAATKTAKFVMSGFIPIVGSAVSDAYSTVRGSFDVIGGTVGTAGVFAVLLILLPPVAEIIIFRFVMWIGAAAADMFSASALSKLLKGFDSGLAVAQSVIICYGVMFILSTAILMQTTS